MRPVGVCECVGADLGSGRGIVCTDGAGADYQHVGDV